MSGPPANARRSASARQWTPWSGSLILLGVVAVVAASFVLPGAFNKKTPSTGAAHAMALGAAQGAGLPAGSAVPAFGETDLLSGRPITSSSVYRHKTLLFFSEGVMCQACFEQIQGLQQVGMELKRRGIQLISVTPDSPSELRQAVAQYRITTPVISDSDRSMSEAFNTLGRGMHADTPGHAFVLVDNGKVRWYHDYWLAPDRTMFVPAKKLLADIPDA